MPALARPTSEIVLSLDAKLSRELTLGGIWPEIVQDGASFQITAELPDGSVYPLLWLQNYKMKFNHPFFLRAALELPSGTIVRGVPRDARIGLIPAVDVPPPEHQIGEVAEPLSNSN